ncbi:nucleoside triphosphate pyrophosphohydrolase [Vibrio viridaestus]|uniref:Nucleoside triphosphate pyrophosphohydrolase n=1 Tax=Vibrio viridaestus TaxID=2487322 RepID=A0A3N9TIP7_9VIBR|nr:nucleoside triphosphate pyrophosphohydrolase [Vibrio viridaestus]RQW63783.1 nucleoside triphosphate pyrophosphohydrolase [Vibrio viridaestus]
MASPIEELQTIMEKLRDPETGCPWDKKQSFDTIVPCTIEETYEVVDAINNRDWANLREELGDFVFQAIFYCQLAKEQSLFDFDDVISELNEKLVRRHPHVFGEEQFANDDEIRANWDRIKQQEKASKSQPEDNSILDSIPQSLPGLSKATKIQKKCAKFGFDWQSLGPVVAKVHEEIDEVMEEAVQVSIDQEKLEEEVGDLLFAVVNLSRHLKCDPEVALQKANLKFTRRFKGIESIVYQQGKNLDDFSLEQLDAFWEQVKVLEKQKSK